MTKRSESQIIRDHKETGAAPEFEQPPEATIDGIPMMQWIAQEQALNERGMTAITDEEGNTDVRDGLAKNAELEPYNGGMWADNEFVQRDVPLADEFDPTKDVPLIETIEPPVSDDWAFARAQIDSILIGDTEDQDERVAQYKDGATTVEGELISFFEDQYSRDFIDQGVLDNLEGLTDLEKAERISDELIRLDANKADIRNLVALNLLRQGFGGIPATEIDKVWKQVTPQQAEALLTRHRKKTFDEMNRIIDRIAAREGEGFTTGTAVREMITQDIIPFWGATTRIIGTNQFLPEEVDINVLRRGFPGEIRQELREWWVKAEANERKQWLEGIDAKFEKLRRSGNSSIYTRYLAIENLMGTFTDQMLHSDNPNDGFDRVMGNLDTALGMIVGVGLFAKRGKSFFELWNGGKYSHARNVAAAGGSRPAQDALDSSIKETVEALGWTIEEISVKDLPKPKQLELDFGVDVEPDTVKHTTVPNDARRARILAWTDTADITLLDADDLADATRRELQEWENLDGVHVHHKMSTVRGLDNNTGIDMTVTLGEQGGAGWNGLRSLLDDMEMLDPYQEFRVMRRNADGQLEEVPFTFKDIVEYRATGRVPLDMEEFLATSDDLAEMQRYFGGRRLDKVPEHELAAALDNGWIPPDMPAWGTVRRELDRRANPEILGKAEDPLTLIDGDELFVQIDKTHFFDAQDITSTSNFFRFWNPFSQHMFTVTGMFSRLFPPNAKFDRVYDAAREAYHMEEAALEQFADILVPFDKLASGKKEQVASIVEYVEDFAKDAYHTDGIAKTPTRQELLERFPDVSEDVWDGYGALTDAMDGMYDVLNRRQFRDFNNRGFVTIRGTDDGLPNYHGQRVPTEQIQGGSYYDPAKRAMVKVSKEDAIALAEEGGGVLKLDFPISAKDGSKFDRVLVRRGEYEFGKLSEKPLTKHAGYHYRFYEDPWYVIKRNYDPKVNGRKVTPKDVKAGKMEGYGVDADGRVYYDEAVRTANSYNEGIRFFNRRGKDRKYLDDGKGVFQRMDKQGGHAWLIKPGKQLNNTEGTLYQTQALHYQGRLFWDERSYERLPDVGGNRAKIADPAQAMQKGMAMAMRQSTQEGLFRTMKKAFVDEYKDLPKFESQQFKLEANELRQVEKELSEGIGESFGETRRRYQEARELIRYMRSQLGTDSFLVPQIRQTLLHQTQWLGSFLDKWPRISRATDKVLGWSQKHAMELDPFARMRKVAYGAFMVLRPVRQFALQSMQVSFLMGLAPSYIGSGRVFLDAGALRRGVTAARRAGFDDGWSDSSLAKAMGLKPKEYKRLVEEFQRSGLLGSVNTHAFNASARNIGARLPDADTGIAGRMMYKTRAGARKAFNLAARGFELGEMNNLTFTYMIALRRFKKANKVDDLTKLSRSDWNAITKDADALALGMTRPNKFSYQSGAAGMVFQFMSFQHRALLSLAGMNPAIGKDAWKIVIANYALWGSNIMGLEDYTREWLTHHGIDGSNELWPGGPSIQDAMAAGLIETGFNTLGGAISENWNDLNLGIFAPGAAVVEIYKGFLEFLVKAPMEELSFLGPAGNPVSGLMKGYNFMRGDLARPDLTAGEKLLRIADAYGQHMLPQWNDANQTWLAIQLGDWRDTDGDKLGIQPAIADLVARGLMGIRPEAETDLYRMKSLHWENQENVNDWVKKLQPVMKRLALDWIDGQYTDEQAYTWAAVLHSLTEGAPEGIRREIYERVMNEPDFEGETVISILAQNLPNASMNLEDMLPYMNKSTQLTPKQKEEFRNMVQSSAEGSRLSDQMFRQKVETELERGPQ